ncbi:MAG: CPBP family intramembrane metalloprotease [Chloroflexi bacterium]|nr:CPBP family intramembrane metalloprotease [Chloroflexota bacterium]
MTETNSTVLKTAPRVPAWRDLILYVVIGGGGFIVASVIAGAVMHVETMTLPVSLVAYTLNIVFFAGSVLVVGVARGKLSLRAIGFFPPRLSAQWFGRAIVLSLALLPLRGVVGLLAQSVSGDLNGLQERMNLIAPASFTWFGFIATLLGAGILVPIAEELFFRGALFTWFRTRYNFPLALLASSALFALGHLDALGVVASSFVLALANAWVFEKSKTLWAPIIMHITTNSFAVLLIYGALAFAPQLLER